jgi:hypothetical protein
MTFRSPSTWNFDIDRYLNPLLPSPPWELIPYPVSRFLGYRKASDKKSDLGNLAIVFWSTIGIFSAIILIELASHSVSVIDNNGPIIVASFVSRY